MLPRNGGGYIVNETKQFSNEETVIIRDALRNFIPSFGELVHENFTSQNDVESLIAGKNALRDRYIKKGVTVFSDFAEMEQFQKSQPEEFRILSEVNTYNYVYNFPNRLLTDL